MNEELIDNNVIIFDTETTGFYNKDTHPNPRILQLSYILYNLNTQEVLYITEEDKDIVSVPEDTEITESAFSIHKIDIKKTEYKKPIKYHIDEFIKYCNRASIFVGHNIKFDIDMILREINNIKTDTTLSTEEIEMYDNFIQKLTTYAFCTLKESRSQEQEAQQEAKHKNKKIKLSHKLADVHRRLFNQEVGGELHNALVDISVTLRVYVFFTSSIDSRIDICDNRSPYFSQEIYDIIKPTQLGGGEEEDDYALFEVLNTKNNTFNKYNEQNKEPIIEQINCLSGGKYNKRKTKKWFKKYKKSRRQTNKYKKLKYK
jgi:DNA polymerase III epsilon subunit-like protein